jgi:hypothetical protein
MDHDDKQTSKKVKTMGNLAFNGLISTLSESSKQDLVDSFLDSLTSEEQRSLLENLSSRVNNGIKSISKAYHYVIINTSLCRILMDPTILDAIYDATDHTILENKLEVIFIGDDNKMEHKTSYNQAWGIYQKSPEYETLHQKLLEKDPINHKFLKGICFKLDPTGIMDHFLNTRKIFQQPMCLYDFGRLSEIITESSSHEAYDALSHTERENLLNCLPSESLEFSIQVKGQKRFVLYWNLKME